MGKIRNGFQGFRQCLANKDLSVVDQQAENLFRFPAFGFRKTISFEAARDFFNCYARTSADR
jgi:hypothetical protein